MAQQDVYQVDVIFNHPLADGEMAIIYHYRLSSVGTPRPEEQFGDDLVELFDGEFALEYMANIGEDFTLVRLDWFNVSNPIFGGTRAVNLAGSQTGDNVALRSAPVIKKLTGMRGRSFRGRNFYMAPPEASQTDGQISLAYQSALQALVDSILDLRFGIINQNVYRMTVFSPTLTEQAGGVVVDNLVVNQVVTRTMGSQRGRQAAG